jgi:hypothetical protein
MINLGPRDIVSSVARGPEAKTQVHVLEVSEKIFVIPACLFEHRLSIDGRTATRRKYLAIFAIVGTVRDPMAAAVAGAGPQEAVASTVEPVPCSEIEDAACQETCLRVTLRGRDAL